MIPIVFASMPFGPLDRPSLGLSLLQAGLQGRGIRSRAIYFTLDYAAQAGTERYEQLSSGSPFPQDLLGEWIFSGALREGDEAEWKDYRGAVLEGGSPGHRKAPEEIPSWWTELLDAVPALRAGASAFADCCAREILEIRPKIVGFTSVFEQTSGSLAVARRIKEADPSILVVLGGANCEGPMGEAIFEAYPFIDAVYSGEADHLFPAAAQQFLDHGFLPSGEGVLVRPWLQGPALSGSPRTDHMDELPVPVFDDYFDRLDRLGLHLPHAGIPFETSRGCWWGMKHHCTFCGLNGQGMAFRSKSQGRALAEFETLTARHPGVPVVTSDNILDMAYFKEFLPALAAKGNRNEMFFEVKANLTKDQLRLMLAAGITKIQPGIESLDDGLLKLMRKGVRAIHNIQLLKWCHEVGLFPGWNLIGGFPKEDPGAYARMAGFMPLLAHLTPPLFCTTIRLDRFSPNFEQADELGLCEVRSFPSYQHVFRQPQEVLDRMAYYFEFKHQDGRDAREYLAPLQRAVAEWKRAHPGASFVGLDKGDCLMLFDTRPVANQPLVLLEGLARWLYLACDGARSIEHLSKSILSSDFASVGGEAMEACLGDLVARHLMMLDGGAYLSLAVLPQDGARPAEATA